MDTSKHKLGLVGATFFIIASLAGSGVIALPQQLAAIGSITLLSFLLVTAGAFCLTLVYVRAGALFDNPSPTALSAYVNPLLGAKSGLFYVYSNLISNVSILIAGLGYLTYFVPSLNHPIVLGCVVITLIWVFTFLALRGAKFITMVVSCSVTALLLSVVITAVFGWMSFDVSLFEQNWNVSHLPQGRAVLSGFAVLLFSYVGVEAVANNYELVNNPKRNVPIATIVGFLVVAVLYIISTTVIEGMFTAKVIQAQPASFSLSIAHIFGSKLLGQLSSLVMAIACLSSFLVWNLSVVSAAKTSADHGFLPKIYSYTNKYKVGSRGLLVNAVLMTGIEIALMFFGSNIALAFNLTVTISVLLVLFPYFWSGIALIKKGFESGNHSVFDITIASLSSVFLVSAFVSADFAELWMVVVCIMLALAAYSLVFAYQKGNRE
ncbi:amino acid permease [Halodesulfovibrio sp.]|jgi:amino acid transporter|uniref:amino acid permease n=1 Tax=Halodesulfovibrio sp. TaxID=1912772 RepID=UPI0025F38334|nr:amino acid permease [Halodesulfovibrio sp.]MCT4534828.1 amino acid permease [Halodesulfovibrio sp.]